MKLRARLLEERGQILPLLAVGLMFVLLALTGFVVDTGRLLLAQRHLQASADAAALAGAGSLPDPAAAAAAATAYADDPANVPAVATGLGADVSTTCLSGTTGCTAASPNAVSVTEHATVSTIFGRFLGLDSVNLKITSTASKVASTQPLDIALVLDRTGSMVDQMGNLQVATSAFLAGLSPASDQVALIVLPPVPAAGGPCASVGGRLRCDYYPSGNQGYVVQKLTNDFGSIQSDVDALQSFGATSYKQALEAAVGELHANGRPGAKQAIVFETDGAANAVPDDDYRQPTSWLNVGGQWIPYGPPAPGALDDIVDPCGSAVEEAGSAGIPVYTVGFHLSEDQTCYEAPYLPGVGYKQVKEQDYDAPSALAAIAAASGGAAFLQEDGSQLAQTFAQVATTLHPPRLVPNGN